jgi:hypothetical protein
MRVGYISGEYIRRSAAQKRRKLNWERFGQVMATVFIVAVWVYILARIV